MSRVNSDEAMDERDTMTGITFRTSRLGSSLSSLYQNYDFHLDIVKITGVLVLLSLMSATLAITNNLHVCESRQNVSDCIKITTKPYDIDRQYNSSLCDYVRQFDLPQQYRATVCLYEKEVRIDFRLFMNGHPTIKGLYFNTRQWKYLKRLVPHIDKSISSAMLF